MRAFHRSGKKVLIIGKLPLPIGGVRIHVQRLIQDLDKRGYTDFIFHDLDRNPFWKVFTETGKYGAVHLHTSNPWFQLAMSLYCQFLQVPLIITYHSNIGRYNFTRNMAESMSVVIADIPIVQNKESLIKTKKLNAKVILMSTFIPPVYINPLNDVIRQQILDLKKQYRYLFCTNAWNVTFDTQGREIYGISELMDCISLNNQSVLIISDPSGNYQRYIKKLRTTLPVNVFWISESHDFWNILEHSHAFVRNTITDGTSLSIQEALRCDTVVFALDSVSRSPACHLYHDLRCFDLEKELEIILKRPVKAAQKPFFSGTVDDLIKLYKRCIDQI